MKNVTVTFAQVNNRKGIATVNSITTNVVAVRDNFATIEVVNQFTKSIKDTIEIVLSLGQKSFKIGGQNFSLTKKFTMYVNIDGEKFELNTFVNNGVLSLDNFEASFKHLDKLAVNLYMTIQGAKGQSLLPTAQATQNLIGQL